MSFPTWKTNTGNSFIFPNSILDGQVDISGTFYNRTGNVIIGDSSNPDFDPSSNGITLNTTRICLGKDSSVTGDNGVAIGNSATTGLQENSISIGYNSIVDASNSVAIGPDASANGLNSIALGYNSGTGSYTNSVALGANSTVGANNVISLGDGTQNVGIGTSSPSALLSVQPINNTNDQENMLLDFRGDFGVDGKLGIYVTEAHTNGIGPDLRFKGSVYNQPAQVQVMSLKPNGNVGIGTTAPLYPLHVSTNVATIANAIRYFSINTTNITYYSPSFPNFANIAASIYAVSDIWTTAAFIATSDKRIKKNITDIQDDTSLEKLRLLKPSYYEYIDKVSRTSSVVEGFIAQEVKEVLPYAVKIQEDYIPNIYCLGNFDTITNVITLIDCSLNTSEFEKDASDNYFTTIKVYDSSNNETIVELTEILNETQFKIEAPDNLVHEIFVYGQKVNNLNVLSKDSIFTVATAALQEVDRQLQAEKVKTATLETQITDILARLDALENP